MTSPMPQEWVERGVPPEAMAAYFEGVCPVHWVPLAQGMFRVGGKASSGWYATVHWIPGGWCDLCEAWWYRPYGPAELTGDGLCVLWTCPENGAA